jgi:hypothetical protein
MIGPINVFGEGYSEVLNSLMRAKQHLFSLGKVRPQGGPVIAGFASDITSACIV